MKRNNGITDKNVVKNLQKTKTEIGTKPDIDFAMGQDIPQLIIAMISKSRKDIGFK